MAEDPGMRAHRLATAVVRQWLGEGHSLYNTVRNVLIEEFADEPACTCIPYHVIGCPSYRAAWDARSKTPGEKT